jgi:hypothetical protein
MTLLLQVVRRASEKFWAVFQQADTPVADFTQQAAHLPVAWQWSTSKKTRRLLGVSVLQMAHRPFCVANKSA